MLQASPQATGLKRPRCHHRAPANGNKRYRTNAPQHEQHGEPPLSTVSGEAESRRIKMRSGQPSTIVPPIMPHKSISSIAPSIPYVDWFKTSSALATPYRSSSAFQHSPALSSAYSQTHSCETSDQRSNPWTIGTELFASCGEPEPCTDPSCLDACPDVVPCHSQEDCSLSWDCFGLPCWDQGCMTDFANQDICCSDQCPPETRCDSPPCYSYDCNITVCESFCPNADTSTCHEQDSDHQDLCHFQFHHENSCIPHCGCIDPQCLTRVHETCDHPSDPVPHHWTPFKRKTADPEYNVIVTENHPRHLFESSSHQPQDSSCLTSAFPRATDKSLEDYVKYEAFSPQTIEYKIQSSLGALDISSEDFGRRSSFNSNESGIRHEMHQCQWNISLEDSPVAGFSLCGQSFSTAEDLHQHVEKMHLNGLPREDEVGNGFFCHWQGCDRYLCRSFQARPKLKRHVQTHTSYKPFICSQCGIQMKTKDAMEKHERTHTGERPYECTVPGCGKEFATSTELKTHMTIHEGRKPHQCPICQECFADSSNLSKHKKTHYAGRYVCPDCGARMKRWDQMRRHIATQEHAVELLHDKMAQIKYKARMERDFSEMPDKQKLL